MKSTKHKNYEILNLIGYGLAKFDKDFINAFEFSNKSKFYEFIVQTEIAETTGVVKNRQDLFDPFFDNPRRGWHQNGDAYIHRKKSIDALFGELNANDYADVVKMYLRENHGIKNINSPDAVSPVRKSQFKQLQNTGYSAEMFFIDNYKCIPMFADGTLEDARMLGDGYDFQIAVGDKFFLTEVKGIKSDSGGFRMTEKEYSQARKYGDEFALIIVSSLAEIPRLNPFLDPVSVFDFAKKETRTTQFSYHSKFTRHNDTT